MHDLVEVNKELPLFSALQNTIHSPQPVQFSIQNRQIPNPATLITKSARYQLFSNLQVLDQD